MYSRKFNGIHSLPPDYSGVALRKEGLQEQEDKQPDKKTQDINEGYGTYPKYPVCSDTDRSEENYPHDRNQYNDRQDHLHHGEEKKGKGIISSIAAKSFSIEDIILAGLILLILNEEERDDELLLILGFLLLIGLK